MKTRLLPLLFLTVLGCKPETKIVEKIVNKTNTVEQNTFGLDYKFTPINDGSEQEKTWGKAIALVSAIEGGSGTGFFISEDGLFLTNEHVIPIDRCSKGKCKGIKIIRDFSPGGALQTFSDFEIVTQSRTLDFTLLKVALPKDQKVPFLNLANEKDIYTHDFYEDTLRIIGHPLSASSRISEVKFDYFENHKMMIKTTATNGNSGSPVMSKKLNKVVGLFNAAGHDSEDIKIKTGFIPYTGEAIFLPYIFDFLKNDKKSQAYDVLTVGRSGVKDSMNAFISQHLGEDSEENGVRKLYENILNSPSANILYDSSLKRLPWLEFALGREIKLPKLDTAPLISKLKSNIKSFEYIKKALWIEYSIDIYFNKKSKLPCLEQALKEKYQSAQIKTAALICQSITDIQGNDLIGQIYNNVSNETDDGWEGHELYLNNMFYSLNALVAKQQLTTTQLKQAIYISKFISRNSPTLGLVFSADNLTTFLQNKPELIAPGHAK